MVNVVITEDRTWQEDGDEVVTVYDTAGGAVCVFSGICPHFGGPVTYDSNKKQFHCAWHDWVFDESGTCINRNVSCKIKIYSTGQANV